MENFIRFLGTSGGRFVMASQLRSSAGTFISLKGKNIILDPGPGTLVRCVDANPCIDLSKIDAIILSHNHIDHSNDLNVIIDVITTGGWNKRKPLLFAPKESIDGEDKVLFNYLRNFVNIEVLKPSANYAIGNLKFKASVEHQHGVETYGIMFDFNGKISFMVDTKYFPGLIKSYAGSEILVINLVMNKGKDKIMHLCVDEVQKILSEIKPKKCIITHFGRTMLKVDPNKVAEKLSEETNTDVIAAEDGMILNLDKFNADDKDRQMKFNFG
ncbi:MAG: hypothetical protein BWK75_03990 [Candidatus Altiarchaeales archaeon A3]|nr:MAG: hypothetical protein BWK75_03990 [Candidatus Altiarchaeales archaeon A3]